MKEGPGVTLDKLGLLRDKLTVRLEALGPGEVGVGLRSNAWTTFSNKNGCWYPHCC